MLRPSATAKSKYSCILCFDFDGTMVNPESPPHLDPDLMLYVQHLRDRGAAWVINTGRSLTHTLEGLKNYGFETTPDFIIAQESELLQPGKMNHWDDVGEWNMERSSAYRHVLKRGEKFFQAVKRFVSFETEGEYLAIRGQPDEIVATSNEEMERILEFIEEGKSRRGLHYLGYQRNSVYLRFGHTDYNKGTTLDALGEHLGLGPERIFAAGDNHNDLPMLSRDHAHALACPGNALDEVKSAIREAGGLVCESRYGRGMIEALGHFFYSES